METSAIDFYFAAFVAQCAVMRRPGQRELDEPGVHGLLASSDDPLTRLLVSDDRACDVLAALLPDTSSGMINVLAPAARCAELIDGHPAWKPAVVTAMICRDLETVPLVPLPSELALRAVRRLDGDASDGVPLEHAAAAAMLADPWLDDPLEVFAGFLRSLSPAIRLFAALDGDGMVRATSGSGVFGTGASVLFVNTDPGWRGRGIGQAMTAAALRAAKDAGARQACLNATDAAVSIYRRLGFEAAARTRHYFRPA